MWVRAREYICTLTQWERRHWNKNERKWADYDIRCVLTVCYALAHDLRSFQISNNVSPLPCAHTPRHISMIFVHNHSSASVIDIIIRSLLIYFMSAFLCRFDIFCCCFRCCWYAFCYYCCCFSQFVKVFPLNRPYRSSISHKYCRQKCENKRNNIPTFTVCMCSTL